VLTRDDVTRVHCVLILDEAKAVHELDLGDLTGAMGVEMGLDLSLGGVARKVAQVQAGRGNFRHRDVGEGEALRNLAWEGGERMLTVNKCQARKPEVEQMQTRGCEQEPVARETRKRGAGQAPGWYPTGAMQKRFVVPWRCGGVALDVLSQNGRPAVEEPGEVAGWTGERSRCGRKRGYVYYARYWRRGDVIEMGRGAS
jgi:hypothetical protein